MPNGNRFAGSEWVAAQTFEMLAKGGIRKGACECELPLEEVRVGKGRRHLLQRNRFAGTRGALFPGRPIMSQAETLMAKVYRLAAAGAAAREKGDELAAEQHFHGAFELAMQASGVVFIPGSKPTRVNVLRNATRLALEIGRVAEARHTMDEAFALDPCASEAEEWKQLQDICSWPDAWLIAAVRRDPPDTEALDELAERHWKGLFARCQLLTLNFDKASDLGQEAWCRALRARHTLKPGGNLPAYLARVATNLWRDRHRSARRAGPLAEERMLALDAPLSDADGQGVALGDVLPDLNGLQTQEHAMLALDIDQALERLTPQLRDVLVARYIIGESCAEIGRRYGRTEQTISSWVRAAVRAIQIYFEEQNSAAEGKEAR